MTGLKIEVAGGVIHLTAYSERGQEVPSAALVLRIVAELALKPRAIAVAFEIEPEVLAAALSCEPALAAALAKISTYRGEKQ